MLLPLRSHSRDSGINGTGHLARAIIRAQPSLIDIDPMGFQQPPQPSILGLQGLYGGVGRARRRNALDVDAFDGAGATGRALWLEVVALEFPCTTELAGGFGAASFLFLRGWLARRHDLREREGRTASAALKEGLYPRTSPSHASRGVPVISVISSLFCQPPTSTTLHRRIYHNLHV